MDTWMSEAMVVEATLFSFLMALWIAWLSLRGLFGMLPRFRIPAVRVSPATERGVGAHGRRAA
jgi:hypothetical protein